MTTVNQRRESILTLINRLHQLSKFGGRGISSQSTLLLQGILDFLVKLDSTSHSEYVDATRLAQEWVSNRIQEGWVFRG